MFIWDYIITFTKEVDLVWKSKWSFMKGLYLFQRYLPFIDTVFFILYRQSWFLSDIIMLIFLLGETGENLTETACQNIYYASGGSYSWLVVTSTGSGRNSLFIQCL